MKLRDYQLDCLQKSKARYDSGVHRQLVALPTGTGKTCVFAALPEYYGNHGNTMVLVHRDTLAKQAADKLQKWNPTARVGLEMAEQCAKPTDTMVVASVPTIGREDSNRIKRFLPNQYKYIICDEAHHSVADGYKRVFKHFGFMDGTQENRLLFGVTATTKRGDGQPLSECYDEVVAEMSILDAINAGWLCNIIGIGVYTKTALDKVDVRLGDFVNSQLSKTVNTAARNDLIVRKWKEVAADRQTIVFAVDVQHAHDLAAMFRNHGVQCKAIWADDPDRDGTLDQFTTGRLPVIVNVGILTEGFDYWNVGCVLMARPTKSNLLYIQMCGRGTRIPENIVNLKEALKAGVPVLKQDCILLDVVDNSSKHSLVNAASIFGLPKKMDLQGATVTSAVSRINQAMLANPNLDLTDLQALNQLEATIRKLDLFKVSYAPEVQEYSSLRWHEHPGGGFVLPLANKESIRVTPDLLDKWNVKGTVKGNWVQSVESAFGTVKDAFNYAEQMVTAYSREQIGLLKRSDGSFKWHKDGASESQRSLLQKLMRTTPPANLTKGEASELITLKLQELRQRKGY